MKSFFFIFFSFFCLQSTFAQLEKSIHQIFELDELKYININLQGEVEVEKWAGNTLMTETKIKLYDASAGILNYFVKEGRYEIIADLSDSQIRLKSKDTVRRPIQTKIGQCFEEVVVKVYMPEDFEGKEHSNLWTRVEKSEDTDSTTIKKTPVIKDTITQDTIKKF